MGLDHRVGPLVLLTPKHRHDSLQSGHSAEEMASERGVSLPHVRTQIRQMLAKTGASHLRDLGRLLAGLLTVWSPGTAS
jgi:DNA-binding CsgD family transcriptional regulator